jgi:Siphovirus ReqiPepy6 Gp37-like protein
MTTPISNPFYRVIVRNSARTRVGEIQGFTSLSMSPLFNDVGTWSLLIPYDHPQAAYLTPGAWLTFMAGNIEVCSGHLRGLKRTWSSTDVMGGTLNAYGPTAEVVLSDRLVYPVPGSPASTQTAFAYDTRSGPGETVIKQWVNVNAGPGAIAARVTKGFLVDPDLGQGSAISGSGRMDNLLTFIQPLAEAAGLGFRVVFGDDDTMNFQTFVPRDMSGIAKFGTEMGNLSSFELLSEASKSSAAIVGGSGDLTARVFREIDDTQSSSIWGARSETFVDRRDTADPVQMDQSGTSETVVNGPITGLTIKTVDTPYLVFGVDYGLGDVVSLPEFGITDILRGVNISWTATASPLVDSTVGTWSKTGTSAMAKKLAALDAQIASLATKK